MYVTRIDIRYFDETFPGCRLILNPDQVTRWGWTWESQYDTNNWYGTKPKLYCLIDPDPNSEYHFLISYQHTQSMKETISSLPARIHVPSTGTNTFQVPLYDLMPTLDLLVAHEDYDIIVHQGVYDAYNQVVKEDDLIKSLAEISDEEKGEIARIREVIERSAILNKSFEPFRFQVAGIAMMLHIYGVADKMVPGLSQIQRPKEASVLTPADDMQLSLILQEYINS